jgi:hypothetical protein
MECFSYKLQVYLQLIKQIESIMVDYSTRNTLERPSHHQIYRRKTNLFKTIGMCMVVSDNLDVSHTYTDPATNNRFWTNLKIQDSKIHIKIVLNEETTIKSDSIRLGYYKKQFAYIKQRLTASLEQWLVNQSSFRDILENQSILNCHLDKDSEIGCLLYYWGVCLYKNHTIYAIVKPQGFPYDVFISINKMDNDYCLLSLKTLYNGRKKTIHVPLSVIDFT